jgi:hypothetical protein
VDLAKHRPDLRKRRVDLRKRRAVARPPAARTALLRRAAQHSTRATRATRAWARRPSGRLVLPGLLIAALIAIMVAAGVTLPQAAGTDRAPNPGASAPGTGEESPGPEESAPDTNPALPPVDPSAEPGKVGDAEQGVSQALTVWAAPMAVRTGIPVVALQAYASAEMAVSQTKPACNLRWTTLAGIGYAESNHGRSDGATLTNDGRATPPIIGAPLDGQGGRKAIPDTDGGRLDNDRTWDRAIGPMQFIPSTWARYAGDGDGDGVADPHNIYDAALAAATLLCGDSRNLSLATDWWNAILGYNQVQTYAQNVYNAANSYGLRSRS